MFDNMQQVWEDCKANNIVMVKLYKYLVREGIFNNISVAYNYFRNHKDYNTHERIDEVIAGYLLFKSGDCLPSVVRKINNDLHKHWVSVGLRDS